MGRGSNALGTCGDKDIGSVLQIVAVSSRSPASVSQRVGVWNAIAVNGVLFFPPSREGGCIVENAIVRTMTARSDTERAIARTLPLLRRQKKRRYPDQRFAWTTFGLCAKLPDYRAGQLMCDGCSMQLTP